MASRDVEDLDDESDAPESAPTTTTRKAHEDATNIPARRVRIGLLLGATVAVTGAVVASVLVWGVGRSKSTSTLDAIRARGRLVCGIQSNVDVDTIEQGPSIVGFNVDLCKALAAAILESSVNKISLVTVSPSDRFLMLNNRTVDVLISSTTHTMERQIHEPTTGKGFAFSIPYLYGGLMFGGVPPYGQCTDALASGNATARRALNCGALSLCVVEGTTYARDLPTVLQGEYTVKLVSDLTAQYEHFARGECNVLVGDEFETAPSMVQAAGYTGPYQVGTNFYSREPLTMVTRQDDVLWSDFVNWIVQSLIGAEEQGITQARAASMLEPEVFGEKYKYMFVDAIEELGNYGELYARRLGGIVERKAINDVNTGSTGTGLLYAMPFGTTESDGPAPVAGSTLYKIQQRGFLKCGVTAGLFSIFNATSGEWSGFDVDFCRALSAAIFGGVTNTVEFSELTSVERFVALGKGDVDVLSRITTVTLVRDIMEPTSQAGFTFAQPNFYDGVLFGGVPPFGMCANDLEIGEDTRRAECAELKVCVAEGTTTLDIVKRLFPETFTGLVPRQSNELVAQGIQDGVCNVISGGVGDVLESNLRIIGKYEGPYEIGTRIYSKDPLALVTRQDDHQWSSFVYWIVSATFHAEDRNITSTTSDEMPIVNLFGSDYSQMFRDAIAAVGCYKEIYDRNMAAVLPRGGLNLQNTNPLGPQHYSLPGLEK